MYFVRVTRNAPIIALLKRLSQKSSQIETKLISVSVLSKFISASQDKQHLNYIFNNYLF